MNHAPDECQPKIDPDEHPLQLDFPEPHQSLDQQPKDLETAKIFRNTWHTVTDDNYFTLFGFRRFRTSHLLNLRLLENEIDGLGHQIY